MLFFSIIFIIFEFIIKYNGKDFEENSMSRRCQLTGIGPVTGNHVSHAHNRRKRRFLPNLQKKRVWVQELNRFVTLKLSAKAIKTISRNGTSDVAKLINEKKIKAR
jgi:large subunit ribosomal protein L28